MTLTLLHRETYLSLIKESIGSKMFRTSWALVGGTKKDILKNGLLSCAFYASSVLVIAGLLPRVHATVAGTVRDMESSGWKKVSRPRPGDVLVWEGADTRDGIHTHIGFYVGKNSAVSNSSTKGVPLRHHWTFGAKGKKPVRRVTAIFRSPKLS